MSASRDYDSPPPPRCIAANHAWIWKSVDSGYWVVCQECGRSDGNYMTEEGANRRVKELVAAYRRGRALSAARASSSRYGFNRRLRKARAARRAKPAHVAATAAAFKGFRPT